MRDAESIARELGEAKRTGDRWSCRCPAHDDRTASLTLKDGDKPGVVLVKCHAGCDREAVIDALKRDGLWGDDRHDHAPRAPAPAAEKPKSKMVAAYDYVDANGVLLFQACRMEPKRFVQRRPAASGTGWEWSLGDTPLVVYRLPEVLAAGRRAVFIVEGEKDADALASMGCIGTTSPMGAGKWRPEFAQHFRGKTVVILPDNDDPGENHAADIWDALTGVAASLRVVRLPGLPPKGDFSDWLAAGGTKEQLAELVKAAFAAPAAPPERRTKATPLPKPADAPPAPPAATVTDIGVAAAARALPQPIYTDLPPEYSDDRGAMKFTARYGSDLRFVSVWGKWLQWRENRWSVEDTLYALDLARTIAREQAIQASMDPTLSPRAQAGTSAACASAKYIANIERLAKADRTHAATIDQWDRDPWLLNTPACVIDLRTGATRPARIDDYVTKQTAVAPTNEGCPRWLRFLSDVTDGDTELQSYLQRLAGYALTGVIREHMLAFFYGTGRNGKGVFLNTITSILADYARVSSMDTFTESKNERHSTELAMLRGARLVTAQETEEGRRWAEAKIKAITGGDPITTRFMRQDFFTFQPQFKLLIAGNHKPGLRNVDEAIKARLHLVPFTVTIPEAKRDPELPERLRAEHGAILRWMIEGTAEWQSTGLRPPTRVTEATREYLQDEDILGRWLEERCDVTVGARHARASLYRDYGAWAEANGEFVLPMKRWLPLLANRGLHERTTSGLSVLDGVRLRADDEPRGSGQGDWMD